MEHLIALLCILFKGNENFIYFYKALSNTLQSIFYIIKALLTLMLCFLSNIFDHFVYKYY